jgi:hypothetical protein
MAQVDISLEALDKIRDDLKEAKGIIVEKDKVIKEKDEEIIKVIADKRTLKTTITKSPKIRLSEPDLSGLASKYSQEMLRIISSSKSSHEMEARMRYHNSGGDYYSLPSDVGGGHVLYQYMLSLAKEVNNTNLALGLNEETKTEYVNFDDVLSQIRTEVEGKLSEELNTQRARIASLSTELGDAEIKKNQAIKKVEDDFILIKEGLNKSYEALQSQYDNLLADKETKTLQEQIITLEAELKAEKNKKWYQKIFN